MKNFVRSILLNAGACRVGFAVAEPVDNKEHERYSSWLNANMHGEMAYLEKYEDLRRDPRLLLVGARTVISCAFDYRQPDHSPLFADYALGEDYHNVIRKRLSVAADTIKNVFGGDTRICVDTAPIHERYWAVKAGIGFLGLNGQLIVDGIGSKVFLAEILWTVGITPDSPTTEKSCGKCGACVKACPGQALNGNGGLDARKCHSYLSIEYRGDLPQETRFNGKIYGCDACQDVCPLNIHINKSCDIAEFTPSPELMSLTTDKIKEMDADGFSRIFRHSAVKRTKLAGLKRNAARHGSNDKS